MLCKNNKAKFEKIVAYIKEDDQRVGFFNVEFGTRGLSEALQRFAHDCG